MLAVDRPAGDPKGVELGILHDVVAGEVAERQELPVVHMDLVASLHAPEPLEVGLAVTVSREQVSGGADAIELATLGLAADHLQSCSEPVSIRKALDLDGV